MNELIESDDEFNAADLDLNPVLEDGSILDIDPYDADD